MMLPLRTKAPPKHEGIDLRCCDVAEVLRDARGARLVIADPPWQYSPGAAGKGMAQPELNDIYDCLSDRAIVDLLDRSYDCADPDGARLAVWYTWPKDAEWTSAGGAGPRWGGRTTGGAWLKTGNRIGVGYHWRGQTEPVAVFTRGATGRPSEVLLNGYASEPGPHSEKPEAWLRAWVRSWTQPGDLVVDLFAGLGVVARACLAEGRRYMGAEIDPERHERAMVALAQVPHRWGVR